MFENISNVFKKIFKAEGNKESSSGKEAKERLHLVLMQDRANVSADFLDMMKQEIIEVIKKYIDVDENAIDVRLTNQTKEDGTNGAPALYANIPIISIKEESKNEVKKQEIKETEEINNKEIKENEQKEDNTELKEENNDENKKEDINEQENLDKEKNLEESESKEENSSTDVK